MTRKIMIYSSRKWWNTVLLLLEMSRDKWYCQTMFRENNDNTSFKDICVNKPPLPTDVFDAVNNPISCIHTTALDYIEGSNGYSLTNIAKYSRIPCENRPSSVFSGMKIWITHVSRDSRISYQLVPTFIINKHIRPFGICNAKYQCYLNTVIQLLLPIFRTIRHISGLIQVWMIPYQNVYLKQHIVHPILEI